MLEGVFLVEERQQLRFEVAAGNAEPSFERIVFNRLRFSRSRVGRNLCKELIESGLLFRCESHSFNA